MAARAKKNFWQSDLLTPSARECTIEIWSTRTYTEFDCAALLAMLLQQIANDNIANQIHGFIIDYGKFILMFIVRHLGYDEKNKNVLSNLIQQSSVLEDTNCNEALL